MPKALEGVWSILSSHLQQSICQGDLIGCPMIYLGSIVKKRTVNFFACRDWNYMLVSKYSGYPFFRHTLSALSIIICV